MTAKQEALKIISDILKRESEKIKISNDLLKVQTEILENSINLNINRMKFLEEVK